MQVNFFVICLKCGTEFIYLTAPCPYCGNKFFVLLGDKDTELEFVG